VSRLLLAIVAIATCALAQGHRDETYTSKVFGGPRSYRLFLPASYQTSSDKRYGVIYYFHGHSDRYTLEHYDKGQDTVPKIEAYVASHDVIVVAPDGFDARNYTGFYGGTPYDVRQEGGDLDFAQAFRELVAHVDATYRTLNTRRYRATAGLSMGGFMSLWISARYPELIGTASAFNPGPEFYLGEKGRRSLWRPKDHVLLHESTPVRLIRASGDYISQYHEETRAAYARTPSVDFEYRQDEYHRHWATSIAETFDFHLRGFADAKSERLSERWTYTSPFRQFDVRSYAVRAASLNQAALISLEDVSANTIRVRTRQWAPDGPPAVCDGIEIETAPLYQPGRKYDITSFDLRTGASSSQWSTATADGRLRLTSDCKGRQFVIGNDKPVIALPPQVPYRFVAGEPQQLTVRVLNAKGVAKLTSDYPTVQVLEASKPAASVMSFPLLLNASSTEWAHARLQLDADGNTFPIDIEIAPDGLDAPVEMKVLDGRSSSFTVFRQKGNQGGGGPVTRTVKEGSGNGDGVLQPGERATIWLKYKAGIDGLDRGNWCRAKVYAGDSRWLTEVEDIQEQKQLEWTSAMNRTSVIALDPATPRDTEIPLILDCESWTYYYTPDVRYGREPLYQAFQFHKHHLFRATWRGTSNVLQGGH
jgi:poly(3-hydroxybutyrate) depolymerase